MTAVTARTKEKIWLAPSRSPSPSLRDTIAVVPVPNMVPSATTTPEIGYTILIAENPSVPMTRDTMVPSTTLYIARTIIITIEGSVKRSKNPGVML